MTSFKNNVNGSAPAAVYYRPNDHMDKVTGLVTGGSLVTSSDEDSFNTINLDSENSAGTNDTDTDRSDEVNERTDVYIDSAYDSDEFGEYSEVDSDRERAEENGWNFDSADTPPKIKKGLQKSETDGYVQKKVEPRYLNNPTSRELFSDGLSESDGEDSGNERETTRVKREATDTFGSPTLGRRVPFKTVERNVDYFDPEQMDEAEKASFSEKHPWIFWGLIVSALALATLLIVGSNLLGFVGPDKLLHFCVSNQVDIGLGLGVIAVPTLIALVVLGISIKIKLNKPKDPEPINIDSRSDEEGWREA